MVMEGWGRVGFFIVFVVLVRQSTQKSVRSLWIGIEAKSGSSQRGQAWIVLQSKGDVAEARKWADAAMIGDPKHSGTSLLDMAVDIWTGKWEATKDRFDLWVRDLPKKFEFLLQFGSNRLAALLRRIRDQNGLPHVAQLFRSVAERPCWRPWSLAVDAVLEGKDPASLADPKAAAIYRLLNKPD